MKDINDITNDIFISPTSNGQMGGHKFCCRVLVLRTIYDSKLRSHRALSRTITDVNDCTAGPNPHLMESYVYETRNIYVWVFSLCSFVNIFVSHWSRHGFNWTSMPIGQFNLIVYGRIADNIKPELSCRLDCTMAGLQLVLDPVSLSVIMST